MHTPSAPPLLTPPMQGVGTQPGCPVTCDHWERGLALTDADPEGTVGLPTAARANFQVSKLGRGQRVSPSCVGRTEDSPEQGSVSFMYWGCSQRQPCAEKQRSIAPGSPLM